MRDNRNAKNIFFLLTHKCNLRCVYCYEADKNAAIIDINTIKTTLIREFSDTSFCAFDVIFHGGEPFLCFDMMKEVCEWIWNNYADLDVRCLVTTNGTLLNDKNKEWLKQNKDRFILILSLDGGRKTHNANRSNSFDKIDFAFIRDNWPEQRVKMTIGPGSLDTMFDDMMEIRKLGFYVNPSLAQEVDWNMDVALPTLERELLKLIEFYLSHPEVNPCPLMAVSPKHFAYITEKVEQKACGAGTHNVAYDTDGHRYPCHAFITNFGKSYNEEIIEGLFTDLCSKRGWQLAPKCIGCPINNWCEPCYGLNYGNRNDMGDFNPNLCAFNKLIVKANVYFYSRMMMDKDKYPTLQIKTKEELQLIAQGILNIQAALFE